MANLRPIVIAGPSGSGKDTIIKKILDKYPFIHDALGYTTRQQREGEINGKDINFVSLNEFEILLKNNKLFEYSYFDGNYYGMPISEIENAYSQLTIFNISIDAAKKLKEYDSNIITILIIPPTKEELLLRLGDRGIERYNRAYDDIKLALDFFDNLVINYTDQIDEAIFNIENIIFNDSKEYLIKDSIDFLYNYFNDRNSKVLKIKK